MTSIDRQSIRNFIAQPNNYHLVQEQGRIRAMVGRTPADEAVHKVALEALNNLPISGIASFFAPILSLFSFFSLSMIKKCQEVEFIYKIERWAQEAGQGPQENRTEAVKKLKEAYKTKASRLVLINLKLTSLPAQIGQLIEVTDLILSGNRLTALPPEVGKLNKMQALYLDCNRLDNLPVKIENLKDLRLLILDYNRFETLPPHIGGLTKLEELHIRNNQLTNFPQELGNLKDLKKFVFIRNPIDAGRNTPEFIATFPFMLNLPCYKHVLNLPAPLERICELNGLALQFIPENKQTEALVTRAITQNVASIVFVAPWLIGTISEVLADYQLAKRAIAFDPSFIKFIPLRAIDVAVVLAEIQKEPYLLSLLTKIGAFDQITEAMCQKAVDYDYRLLGAVPGDIQYSDFGDQLIKEALEKTPKAYYGIEPSFFNEKLLSFMMQRHKDNPDLKVVLKDIIMKMDTDDQILQKQMSDFSYPLSQYFHDDKQILLMLILKYGISLMDLSDAMKADYEIVRVAIARDPGEFDYCKVTDPAKKKLLQAYAKEIKRQRG